MQSIIQNMGKMPKTNQYGKKYIEHCMRDKITGIFTKSFPRLQQIIKGLWTYSQAGRCFSDWFVSLKCEWGEQINKIISTSTSAYVDISLIDCSDKLKSLWSRHIQPNQESWASIFEHPLFHQSISFHLKIFNKERFNLTKTTKACNIYLLYGPKILVTC